MDLTVADQTSPRPTDQLCLFTAGEARCLGSDGSVLLPLQTLSFQLTHSNVILTARDEIQLISVEVAFQRVLWRSILLQTGASFPPHFV